MTRLSLILALLLALATPLRAGEAEARAAAERLIDSTHAALTLPGGAPARDAALKTAIAESFAFDVWERFILSGRDAALTEAERAEFRALLPGYVANLYRERFGETPDAKPAIEGIRQIRRDFLVRATVPRAQGPALPVDWRIRDFGARGHLVGDIMVGGVSFLVLKRDEFAALLDREGAEGLLAVMRRDAL